MLLAAIAAQASPCTPLQYFAVRNLLLSTCPSWEALLRTVDLAEELITILRVRNVVDRDL